MARNIEIKARINGLAELSQKVAMLADEGPFEISQDDTFFRCDAGRLKLRVFEDGTGELIFYQRSNECGPKESFYLRVPAATPDLLREVLSSAYGQAGRVLKKRTLFKAGRTRIHLDRVLGLGDFLELEVVLGQKETPAAGTLEAQNLMRQLHIDPSQLIDRAYVDL